MTGLRRLFVLAAALLLPSVALADDERREVRVQFDPGKSGTVIEDQITGYAFVDYLLGARAGQRMTVSMSTDNLSNYFNLIAPGESDAAFHIGSVTGNEYAGTLPEDGDYRIRVYLMRNAARREETATFRLSVQIAGKPVGADEDALIPGTPFHARGEIACATGAATEPGACIFGVTRRGGGSADVVVSLPDGGERILYFTDGKLTGVGPAQAFETGRDGDMTAVTVGAERYEIPDAVPFGG